VAEPFRRRSRTGEGVLGRVLPSGGRGGCIRAIEDRLAQADSVRDVSVSEVSEIAKAHNVDLARRQRTGRLHLYKRFFEQCLNDQDLSDEESADLDHLREALCLTDADVSRVHDDVAHEVYGQVIDRVLADQKLDPDEEDFLRRLQRDLDLSDQEAERMLSEGEERARRRYLERATSRDDFLLTSRDVSFELSGSADDSLQSAVESTLDEAARAVSGLNWVEVSQIGADVGSRGEVTRWHVKLRARRSTDG